MLHLHRKEAFVLRTGSFLLFGLLLIAQASLAQEKEMNLYDHDSKPYYFGITLGGSMTRFQTEQHSRFLLDDSVLVAEPGNAGGFGLGQGPNLGLCQRLKIAFGTDFRRVHHAGGKVISLG